MFSNDVQPLKYARLEEERRFLIKALPKDLDPETPYSRIIDHYISGTRLRLRRIESPSGEALVFKLGQKYRAASQGAHQTIMTNIYLNQAEYQTLGASDNASMISRRLAKRRYPYPYASNNYSIDVFEGPLSGLILAEIESHADVQVLNLSVPSFAVREVTADPRFTGSELVKLSQEAFKQFLASWGEGTSVSKGE